MDITPVCTADFWRRQYRRTALLYTIFLSAMLFAPVPEIEALPEESQVDKLVHVFLFAMFAAVWGRAFGDDSQRYAKTIGLSILFSLVTELIQGILPWRTGDVVDLLFNCVGIVGGVVLLRLLGAAQSPAD